MQNAYLEGVGGEVVGDGRWRHRSIVIFFPSRSLHGNWGDRYIYIKRKPPVLGHVCMWVPNSDLWKDSSQTPEGAISGPHPQVGSKEDS